MVECGICHKPFEGHVFRWAVPMSYPTKVMEELCSECYVVLHEEQGRTITIHPSNVSRYKDESRQTDNGSGEDGTNGK